METTPNNGNFKISGDWDLQSKQLREKFAHLTDADVKFETGKENELLNRIGNRLGKKREEVISILNEGHEAKTPS